MNIKTLVPIDFSRKITPFINGDIIYNSSLDKIFEIDGLHQKKSDFNNDSIALCDHMFVVSYADRPNTGKQPVADDVIVDYTCVSGAGGTIICQDLVCDITDSCGDTKSWKPNHAAMVEAYQLEEAKHDERMNNIVHNESDGEHYKAIAAITTLEGLGWVHDGGEKWELGSSKKKEMEDMVKSIFEKPIFTKAMHDAGELPMVGMIANYGVHSNVEILKIRYNGSFDVAAYMITKGEDQFNVKWCALDDIKPIQTDEDKLICAIKDALTGSESLDEDIAALLASDKLNITLKGK